jgi:prevent-host-death family protein
MSTVTLEEAQAHLPQLIEQLQPGEEIVITRDEKPVARLTGANDSAKPRRKLGTMQGTILFIAADFDSPLEDFKEYMP